MRRVFVKDFLNMFLNKGICFDSSFLLKCYEFKVSLNNHTINIFLIYELFIYNTFYLIEVKSILLDEILIQSI